MNIELLIKLDEINREIDNIHNIKGYKLNYKEYLIHLRNELRDLKKQIKVECKSDGHYFDIFSYDDKAEIFKRKCLICGYIQRTKHPFKM